MVVRGDLRQRIVDHANRIRWIATTYDNALWTMQIEFAGSVALIVLFGAGKWGARFGGTRVLAGFAMLAAGLLCYRL